MREKRRFIRFNIAMRVLYIIQKKGQKIEMEAIAKDISASGIHILTQEPLQKGDRLELKLFIPNALNPVHLTGLVKWESKKDTEKDTPYRAGIEFIRIEEDNKNTFLKFLCGLMYKKSSCRNEVL